MKIHYHAICSALVALFLTVPLVADTVPKKVYPTATEPEEFDSQVEELLRATVAIGDGFGGPYDRELEDRTRRDERNWEQALARVIRDPGKYGFPLGEQAICVAELRGTRRNDMIVSAVEIYFDEVVKDAMKKDAEFQARGEKVPYNVPGKVIGMMSTLLRFDDPRILHVVLRHLTSDESLTLGTLDAFAIKRIPDALRSCGDTSHRDESLSLAKRLRDAGRGSEADGIEKWAQHAGSPERVKRWPANTDRSGGVTQPSDQGNLHIEKGKKPYQVPWSVILSAIGLVIAAIGTLAWRRTRVQR